MSITKTVFSVLLLGAHVCVYAADKRKNSKLHGNTVEQAAQIMQLTRHDVTKEKQFQLERSFTDAMRDAEERQEAYEKLAREEKHKIKVLQKALRLLKKWDDEAYYETNGISI